MNAGRAALALVVSGLCVGAAVAGEVQHTPLAFSDLEGWAGDDHAAALAVFVATCNQISGPGWGAVCKAAPLATSARDFFENHFTPVLVETGDPGLFTGYFEPEISASRRKTATYRYPIYAVPPDLPRGKPWMTRAQIEGEGALAGRGLELAWLADPVETFFLHVQGSGRLGFADGSAMRVGYAAKNGHGYRSVGKEMARLGLLPAHRVSASAIRAWVRDNPKDGPRMLWHNRSYVFFRELKGLANHLGPIGAMQRPVTAMRSIAVDPGFIALGAPVWVEKDGARPIRSLMVAQDTGSAITGAQRADIFFGSGTQAGRRAGDVRDPGRLVLLVPRDLARGMTNRG